MSKRKHISEALRKTKDPPKATKNTNLERNLRIDAVGIAGLILAVIGLLGLIALWPRPSMDTQEPLNEQDPFSTPFVFSNDSYWDFRNLRFRCNAWNLADANRNTFEHVNTYNLIPPAQTLRAGDKQTIPCTIAIKFGARIVRADVELIANYDLFLIPWTEEKRFRFQLAIGANNRYRWLRQPIHPESSN
jgi:hypothetical protein